MLRLPLYLFLCLALWLAACAAPTAAPTMPTVTQTTGPTAEPPTTEPPTATPTAAEPPTTAPITATATVVSAPLVTPTPFPAGQNPFNFILGPVPTPEGWQVEPCEGEGPFLCVLRAEETAGVVEFLLLPMETLPDFQAILREHGLEPGAIDIQGEAYAAAAVPVLEAFAAEHLATIEADRRIGLGEDVPFMPQAAAAHPFGALPGVVFGFTIAGDAGEGVREQYITYAAFDNHALYLITAAYDPASFSTFATHEDLVAFAPYLAEIVAGLQVHS
jgi:hypothetical protein